MADASIFDVCLTPRGIGTQGEASITHLRPRHLGRVVRDALVERNGFDTADRRRRGVGHQFARVRAERRPRSRVGATGAMLTCSVLAELERIDGRSGLISMCAGGGMAPAIVIERV